MDSKIIIARLNSISDDKEDIFKLISDLSKEEDIEHIKSLMPKHATFFGTNSTKDLIFDYQFQRDGFLIDNTVMKALWKIDLSIVAIAVQEDSNYENDKRIRVWINKKETLVQITDGNNE